MNDSTVEFLFSEIIPECTSFVSTNESLPEDGCASFPSPPFHFPFCNYKSPYEKIMKSNVRCINLML